MERLSVIILIFLMALSCKSPEHLIINGGWETETTPLPSWTIPTDTGHNITWGGSWGTLIVDTTWSVFTYDTIPAVLCIADTSDYWMLLSDSSRAHIIPKFGSIWWEFGYVVKPNLFPTTASIYDFSDNESYLDENKEPLDSGETVLCWKIRKRSTILAITN